MANGQGTVDCRCGCGRIIFYRLLGKVKPDDKPVVFATYECYKKGPKLSRG